jgi:hypothetical protein
VAACGACAATKRSAADRHADELMNLSDWKGRQGRPVVQACIYSAIYDQYDILKAQPTQTVPTDFVCFTDSPRLAPIGPWRIIRNNRRNLSPRMRAKYFKIMSHRIFPHGRLSLREAFPNGIWWQVTKYDYLIWIDGSVQIKRPDFVEQVISHIGNSGWTLFVHPDRDCIYDEALASAEMRKYQGLPIHKQVENYRAEGYPEHNGLVATGIIGRNPRDDRLRAINEMWWLENVKWTHQCQLSLPVVIWRLGRSFDAINLNLWKNELLEVLPHQRDM